MSFDDRYRGQGGHDVWGDEFDDAYDEFGDEQGGPAVAPFADQRLEDSDAFVRSTNGYVGDAEALLRRILEIVATAPTMPLSSSPRLDRDELIELLEECLHRLPEEMRHARWMVKERQEFVAKTRREADELLEAARVQAERMVQRTEVVRAAEQRARQVVEAAETDARRLRHETEDFLDQRLASFEILLDKLSRTVQAGRAKLSIGEQPSEPIPMSRSERGDRGGDRSLDGPGFFDQDR